MIKLNKNFREAESNLKNSFYGEYTQGYLRSTILGNSLKVEYWGIGDREMEILAEVLYEISKTIPYKELIETFLNMYNYYYDSDLTYKEVKDFEFTPIEEVLKEMGITLIKNEKQ